MPAESRFAEKDLSSAKRKGLTTTETSAATSPRFVSLDFLRGFIMVLLALESTGLYEHLSEASEGTFVHGFIQQFFHHPWNGLHFWDLIQPGFMFIAGTALAFSLQKQWQRGVRWQDSFKKVLKRCGWLFFWGVLDYAVQRDGSLSFKLWDVLTQLSFTTLVAFLIFRWSAAAQIGVCVFLLLLTEVLYRFTQVPNFDQPFTDQHNFGNYMDLILMRKINPDGWVAINCIPTAVHTIAGALAGKWLLKSHRVKPLLLWAAVSFAVGYFLALSGITPIIKRIATTSFTLVSLGYCLCALAFVYWWIDEKGHKRFLSFFTIVGMNSLFIYLFFEIVASRWFNVYIGAITNSLMGYINTPELFQNIITSLVIFALEWGLCYFLYRKKVFFKI